MSKVPEWVQFKVGPKSTTQNWSNPDCQPLDRIYHITHLKTAVRVLSDGLIRAGLIFDTSILNTKRIQVIWLSPNNWLGAGGSRYGNVKFSFDFGGLVRNLNYYWVESVAYNIPAARILVTNELYPSLTPFDPSIGDGPWWFDQTDGKHYWNGNNCLEIMYEGDLPVQKVDKVDFVKHHPSFCNVSRTTCPNLGLDADGASVLFLATLVGQHSDLSSLKWVVNGQCEDELLYTWSKLKRRLKKLIKTVSFVTYKPSVSVGTRQAIGRAILAAFARGDEAEAKDLARVIPSEQEVIDACADVVASDFGLISKKSLDDF